MSSPSDSSSQSPQNDPYHAGEWYVPNNLGSPYHDSGPSTFDGSSQQTKPKRKSSCLGCVLYVSVPLAIMFACVFSVTELSQAVQSHAPDIFFQGDWPAGGLGAALFVGVPLLLVTVASKVIAGNRMSARATSAALFLPFAAGLSAALFWVFFINPNIGMTRTGFIRSSTIDINQGDTVYFRNPANGVTQILCLGADEQCQSGYALPTKLEHGLVIQPGQTVSVMFPDAGTFPITSTRTPHMNISIDVMPPGMPNDG